jgi:hypothetical protein
LIGLVSNLIAGNQVMQRQVLVRRATPVLNWILLATLIGAVCGVGAALLVALENAYFESSMRNLAGRVLEIGTFRGALWGLICAAGALLSFVLVWPVCRLLLGRLQTATLGAVLAVAFLAVSAVVAFKINVEVLPAFLSAPSLFANVTLLVATCLLWWILRFPAAGSAGNCRREP